MSSQDKIKKGQRKSAFCGHFMADWDDHHYCPKCRDDLKGDDSCGISSSNDCSVCAAFSEDQAPFIAFVAKLTPSSLVLNPRGGRGGTILVRKW